MYFKKKWNEIMGPKDERLAVEENKAMRAMANILLVGTVIALYYNIELQQVASVTDNPVLTPLGQSVDLTQMILILTLIIACVVSVSMQTRSGFFSSRKRYAEVDRIPWDFVALASLAGGLIVGALTGCMRVLAEVQIVGFENVMWLGDLAIGLFFFMLAFVLCFVFFALSIQDAIKQRRKIESELED